MLDKPAIGGGIQQVSDCLNSYLKRADRNDQKLIEYAASDSATARCLSGLVSLPKNLKAEQSSLSYAAPG